MQVTASNFKAYDIRGIVGKTIDEAFAEHLGRAFGSAAVTTRGASSRLLSTKRNEETELVAASDSTRVSFGVKAWPNGVTPGVVVTARRDSVPLTARLYEVRRCVPRSLAAPTASRYARRICRRTNSPSACVR